MTGPSGPKTFGALESSTISFMNLTHVLKT